MGQTPLTMNFSETGESDPGPYPFLGATSKIEGGTPTACSGDCHVLTIQQGTCLLYEGLTEASDQRSPFCRSVM